MNIETKMTLIRLARCPGTATNARVCNSCPYKDKKGDCFSLMFKDWQEGCKESGLMEVLQLIDTLEGFDRGIDRATKTALDRAGIPAHLDGYSFLMEAVKIGLRDPEALKAVVKAVYMPVAEQHNISWKRVERSIRAAIVQAWGRNEDERPTNRKFIVRVVHEVSEQLVIR